MPLPTILLTGNLTADPQLRFTANGTAVINFRVATSQRVKNKDTGEWTDGDSCFIDVVSWRDAEQLAETLTKGATVMVDGQLKQRTFETKEGEKRTAYEVNADNVALVVRSRAGSPAAKPAAAPADPWATTSIGELLF